MPEREATALGRLLLLEIFRTKMWAITRENASWHRVEVKWLDLQESWTPTERVCLKWVAKNWELSGRLVSGWLEEALPTLWVPKVRSQQWELSKELQKPP